MTQQEPNEVYIFQAGRKMGKVWVLSRELQIDENGNEIDVNLSPFTWPPIGGP